MSRLHFECSGKNRPIITVYQQLITSKLMSEHFINNLAKSAVHLKFYNILVINSLALQLTAVGLIDSYFITSNNKREPFVGISCFHISQ